MLSIRVTHIGLGWIIVPMYHIPGLLGLGLRLKAKICGIVLEAQVLGLAAYGGLELGLATQGFGLGLAMCFVPCGLDNVSTRCVTNS